MCTVSFIATKSYQFIITSNRDEHTSRHTSFEPVTEIINNCKLIYPKDPKAGGTWFAINENGGVGVLLNGAFHKHIPDRNYVTSRGMVLLKIMSSTSPSFYLSTIDLEHIAPFTLILFRNYKLLEFRWDGDKKHFKELDVNQNYIWSSATLYSKKIMEHRVALFDEFLIKKENIGANDIIDFHSSNNNDFENGFVINRDNTLKTLSITQAIVDKGEIDLHHMDLLRSKEYHISVASNLMSNQSQ